MSDPRRPARTFLDRLFPNPGYYGWVVVGVCFMCTALTSPGQSFIISLYIDPLIEELRMSRVGISTLYAVCTLAAAFCLPYVGGVADRVPGRRYLPSVLVLLAGAMLLFASVRGVVTLAIAFFLLRLLGQGSISLGTLTVAVRWFVRYRGRALAMVTLGFAAGELVFPGTVHLLTGWLGWRGSLVVLAALYLLVFAPLVAALLRERGPDEPLDGGAHDEERSGRAPRERLDAGFSRGEALRRPVFWGMLACVAVTPLVMTAVIFHQVAIFESLGWGGHLVPLAFAAFAVGGVVATYGIGLLLETVPVRFGVPIAMSFVILAFVTTALPFEPVAASLVYGGLLGLCAGATGTTNELIWPEYFGIGAVGSLKGVVNAVRNGGTAAGPPMAALMVTEAGLFTWSFVVFGAMSAAAGVAAVFFREPER